MHKRYIIGGILFIAFLAIGLYSLDLNKIEYTNFSHATSTLKKVQVKGTYIKEKGSNFNSQVNQFHFTMKDENGTTIPVVFHGSKPNNFDIAESIVVKGRMENSQFHASEILTKCPSKYEGSAEQLKNS
jgi:cytochrome c-type biogenesis protein CcmE